MRTDVNGINRSYRSDVQFQRPDGSRFALEIQVSGIDAVTARRRTDLTRRDGIEPLWLTSRTEEDWQQLVPCVRLNRPPSGDTRQLRIEKVELFVTGTVEPCRGEHLRPIEMRQEPTWGRARTPRITRPTPVSGVHSATLPVPPRCPRWPCAGTSGTAKPYASAFFRKSKPCG